jgi:hypothetical protein
MIKESEYAELFVIWEVVTKFIRPLLSKKDKFLVLNLRKENLKRKKNFWGESRDNYYYLFYYYSLAIPFFKIFINKV